MTTWTPHQIAIFNSIKNDNRHLFVEALAGSGKTTTLVQACKMVPSDKSMIFLAFNTSVAYELAKRISADNCKSINSLGNSILYFSKSNTCVDKKKIDKILKRLFLMEEVERLSKKISVEKMKKIDLSINNYLKTGKPNSNSEFEKLVGKNEKFFLYPKNQLITFLDKIVQMCKNTFSHTDEEVKSMIDEYKIKIPDNISFGSLYRIVKKALEENLILFQKQGVYDLNDQIYLPVKLNLIKKTYDYIFVDEVQDFNFTQIAFIKSLIGKNSKCILFGDKNQAIYKFRGADKNVFEKFNSILESSVFLPLPICFRCSKSVILEAQKFVPSIQHYPKATEGSVFNISFDEMLSVITGKESACVISRNNATLFSIYPILERFKINYEFYGGKKEYKEEVEYYSNIVKYSKAKNIRELNDYLRVGISKATSKVKSGDYNDYLDKLQALKNLIETCSSLKDVYSGIENILNEKEDKNVVYIGTTHKFKGTEFKNVFLMKDTFSEKTEEEKNLNYVAITRAKENIYYTSNPE